MRKLILSLLVVVCSIMHLTAASSDMSMIKAAIISQLLSDNSNDLIVAELATKYFPEGVDTDQCLMELVAYALPSSREIKRLIEEQNQDGSWNGIYYTSKARSAWEAQAHIKNIMKMARSYKSPSSTFFNSPTLLDALTLALEYWCDNKFVCPNWWYNAIGVPKVLAPALLLLEDDLSEELMAKGIKKLDPADREMTGQNKVWLNGITLIKGVLLNDPSIVARTSEAIKSELRLSEEEGIQYDWSFHQHGAMQQFGNYGLAFASSLSYWMSILNNTSYDFTTEQKEIMRNYVTQGLNVTIWRGYMDVSSCGRQLFLNSQAGKAASLLTSNLNMINMDREAKEEYENYIVRNYLAPETNNLTGNFTFPISKYTIHRADDFLFSVKMFSRRIIGGEITNNENLKGYHLADGATMIYRTGAEYDNIFPFWNWKYIPGTTVEINDKPLKVLSNQDKYLNGSNFVGCLGEGMYGLAAIEYRRNGVEANKSWFFFLDQIVCLGNGAKAESGDNLATTLNQCHYQGEGFYLSANDTISTIEKSKSYSSSKVWSDGIGYKSLDDLPIEFIAQEQSGDWHEVAQLYPSQIVSGEVFSAQIKHEATYGYLVAPSAQKEQFLKDESCDRFKVLRNDSAATAVESTELDLVMVVFWQAGSVESSKCGTITSQHPTIMMVKRENGELITTEYNPIEFEERY